jgi:hypothetical protein
MTLYANLYVNTFSIVANSTGFDSGTFKISANSSGFDATTNTIKIPNASSFIAVNNILVYSVPFDNTVISGLSNNQSYYVTFTNTSSVALSTSLAGANIDITDTRTTVAGETHQFKLTRAFADTLKISNANTSLFVNDLVRYVVPTDNTAIEGLISNTSYYVTFSNTSSVALSRTRGGSNVFITDTRTTSPAETHSLQLNIVASGTLMVNNTLVTVNALSFALETTNTFNFGTNNLAANGYSWLPNRMLMQWGVLNVNTTSIATFSTAFTTSCFSVTVTPIAATLTGANVPIVSSVNTTAATIRSVSTAATGSNAYYIAIGY